MEVTTRTLQGRLLLRPSPELNEVVVGVLGRAQRLYGVEIMAFAWISNHFHLLVWVETAKQLSDFMTYLNSNTAREVARLTGWTEKVWGRRYQAIPVSEEEEAQVARLAYILSHGCKENLVACLRDWPGVHCVGALLDGEEVAGYWFNRSQEYGARIRREEHDRLKYATRETVTLSPLPCWKHLSPEAYRQRVASLVAQIEEDAAAERKRTGAEPLGLEAIRAQHPHTRPERMKKSPAPRVHAFRREVRRQLYEAYSWFLGEYRKAAEKLKAGDPAPHFPRGCFPPASPFVYG